MDDVEKLDSQEANKNFKPVNEEKIQAEASYVKAYLLWLCLGVIGMHRFYLGKWFSGILYFFTFGIFFMGWFLDLLLIPSMIKNRREKLRELQQEIPEEFIPQEAEIAPWASKKDILFYFEFPMQALFFIFTPTLFVLMAIMVNKYELILIFMVILFASSAINFVHNLVRRNPAIERIPALGEALSTFKSLHQYYYENKPRNFIFYLLYFFVGFPMMLLSPSLRREFKLYTKIISSIFIIILIEGVLSYNSTYPPHLGVQDAIVMILVEIFVVSIVIVSFMMPTVTTSFSLSLRGKKNTLQALTFLAFLICIPTGYMIFEQEKDKPSLADSQLMSTRYEKPSFQQELYESSEMFMEYYTKRLPESNVSDITKLHDLTMKYHRHIGGMMTEKEVYFFQVIAFPYDGKELYAILYDNTSTTELLYIVDREQNLYNWLDLAEETKNSIVDFANYSNPAVEEKTTDK